MRLQKLLTILGLFVMFIQFIPHTIYSWWNSSWLFRIPIYVVEQSGTNLTDYQLKINLSKLDMQPFKALNDGLVLSLHFDKIYGKYTPDNSGYECGSHFASNPIVVDGVEGTAIDFDANNYLSITNLKVYGTSGSKATVCFWMYWKGPNGEGQMPFGWFKYDLYFPPDVDCFGFNTFNADCYGVYLSSLNLTNRWVYVCAVFTDSDVSQNKLYIDGVAQPLTQILNSPNNANAQITTSAKISGAMSTPSYRFNGIIDEVRIYNRELTENEVRLLYCIGAYRLNKTLGYPYNTSICDMLLKTYSYSGNDFRFILYNETSGNEEEIIYYKESDKVYWVKLPHIPANGTINLYMYYGNLNATSMSDPYNVFILFDDFDDGVINTSIWSVIGSVSENNGNLKGDGGDMRTWVCSLQQIPSNVYVEFRMRPTSTGDFDSGIQVGNLYFISETGFYGDAPCIGTSLCYPTGSHGPNTDFHTYRATILPTQQIFEDLTSGGSTSASYTYSPGSLCMVGDSDSSDRDTIYSWVRVRQYVDPEPVYTFGSEQQALIFNVDWIYPSQNQYINVSDFTFRFRISSERLDTFDSVTLYLDESPVNTWYNVSNGSILYYNVSLAEGIHHAFLEVSVGDLHNTSETLTFTVDLTPPSIYSSPSDSIIHLHVSNPCLQIVPNVTDNYGVSSCIVTLWNGSIYNCSDIPLTCFDPSDEGYVFSYEIIATDLANNTNIKSFSFSVDFPQGYVEIASASYPDRVPATNFNVSVSVQCINDWCDTVSANITVPPVCDVLSQNPIIIGDMDGFETRNVIFTVKCYKNDTYPFHISTNTATGSLDSIDFTLYPPILNVTIYPERATANDDVYIKVTPTGYGTHVTINYTVVIKRGESYIELVDSSATLPSDIETTLYTIDSSLTQPADKILYTIKLVDPVTFVEEKNGSIDIYEFDPPILVSYSMKYSQTAPHDDNQTFTITVMDNSIVSKIEFYVDLGNGFTLYDSKSFNSQTATATFNITHNESLIGKTIRFFARSYDEFNNSADTSIFEYTVVRDEPPSIYLKEPVNGTHYNTSEILFIFKPTDDFSQNISCEIDDFEEVNVTNDTWFTKEYSLGEGSHLISINCRDDFDNERTIHSNFTIDLHPPLLSNITYHLSKSGVVGFNLLATDNIQLFKFREEVFVNDSLVKFFELPLSGTEQPISFEEELVQFAGKLVAIRFLAYDKAGNSYVSPNLTFAVSPPSGGTVSINTPPTIQIINPIEETYGPTFTIKFKVLDESANVSCSLFLDSSEISIGNNLPTGTVLLRNVTSTYGEHTYYIICTDEQGLRGFSGVYSITLKPKIEERLPKLYFGAYAYMIANEKGSLVVSSVFVISIVLLLSGIARGNRDFIVFGIIGATLITNFVYFVITGNLFGTLFTLSLAIVSILAWEWFKRNYLL